MIIGHKDNCPDCASRGVFTWLKRKGDCLVCPECPYRVALSHGEWRQREEQRKADLAESQHGYHYN